MSDLDDEGHDRQRGNTVTRVLAVVPQRNGQRVHVEIFREGGRQPVLSIALYRRTRAGVVMREGGAR